MEKPQSPTLFFEHVVELCSVKGVSVSKMVDDLKFGNSTVTHWKNGRIPNGIRLGAIAEYLGTTIDYLLLGMDKTDVMSRINLGTEDAKKSKKGADMGESGKKGQQRYGGAQIRFARPEFVGDVYALIISKIAERGTSEEFVEKELSLGADFWERIRLGKEIFGVSSLVKLHRLLTKLGIDTDSYSACTDKQMHIDIYGLGHTLFTGDVLSEISQYEGEGTSSGAYSVVPLPPEYTSDAYKHWVWLPIRKKIKGKAISVEQLIQDTDIDERFLIMLCYGSVLDLHKYLDLIKRLGLSIEDFDMARPRPILLGQAGSEEVVEAGDFFARLDGLLNRDRADRDEIIKALRDEISELRRDKERFHERELGLIESIKALSKNISRETPTTVGGGANNSRSSVAESMAK